jgi:hypothetical protein
MATTPSTSAAAREEWEGGVCVLTYEPLDVDAIMRSVRDDSAGATAVFVGTTRNSFKGMDHTYTTSIFINMSTNGPQARS